VAGALIGHRDGIAGTWMQPGSAPAALALETAAQIERWEPWVRAAIYDFELLSYLRFSGRDESQAAPTEPFEFTMWSLSEATGSPLTVSAAPIVGMVRPTQAIFLKQLQLVEAYADLREDRAAEILAQTSPQYAFWSSIVNLHPTRTRWTWELIDTALRFATSVEMRFKHALACRRPHEHSPQIQPMILTPSHGTLPSGHSTEAHLVAYLLVKLLASTPAMPAANEPVLREQLMRQAARIAINRTVAGVHFPVDSAAGQMLGLSLAEYLVARCTGSGYADEWRFDGTAFGPTDDFDFRKLFDVATGNRTGTAFAVKGAQTTVPKSHILRWLWDKAQKEWS
jgi:membrane-associated phospholipid phosphatase